MFIITLFGVCFFSFSAEAMQFYPPEKWVEAQEGVWLHKSDANIETMVMHSQDNMSVEFPSKKKDFGKIFIAKSIALKRFGINQWSVKDFKLAHPDEKQWTLAHNGTYYKNGKIVYFYENHFYESKKSTFLTYTSGKDDPNRAREILGRFR